MKFYSVQTGENEHKTVCEYCGWWHMFRSDKYGELGAVDLDTGKFVHGERWTPLSVYENPLINVQTEIMGGLQIGVYGITEEVSRVKINYCPMCGRRLDEEEKESEEGK